MDQELRIGSIGASIAIAGPDAPTYLHSQLTQDVLGMELQESKRALLLEPNGHLVASLEITRVEAESFEIVVDARVVAVVAARLGKFLIRTKATIASAQSLDLVLAPSRPAGSLAWLAAAGFYWVRSEQSDPSPSDIGAWDALRARFFAPVVGIDIQDSSLPNSLGDLSNYASFTKGCYTGQELVERVDSRKAVAPRRLYSFGSNGAVLTNGEGLFNSEKQIATVTNVSASLGDLSPGVKAALDLRTELDASSQLGFALVSRGASIADVVLAGAEIANARKVSLVELS